jgi:hypothetical protein
MGYFIKAGPEAPEIPTMPGSIVKALCSVQSTIEAVAKTQFNKQGGYKFASADDIYAAVARKLGDVGLLIYPLELSPPEIKRVEKTNKDGELVVSQWGQFHFGYLLATQEATWFDPRSSRRLFIQILGPQTFNAAESYCQKQFLRALLKLPTGDMDLDSMPQAETEEDQAALANANGAKRKSSSAAKKDGTDQLFNEINRHIQGAHDADSLQFVRTSYAEELNKMPARWVELLNDHFEDRMQKLGETEVAE